MLSLCHQPVLVSYTHLDVYKRQQPPFPKVLLSGIWALRLFRDFRFHQSAPVLAVSAASGGNVVSENTIAVHEQTDAYIAMPHVM